MVWLGGGEAADGWRDQAGLPNIGCGGQARACLRVCGFRAARAGFPRCCQGCAHRAGMLVFKLLRQLCSISKSQLFVQTHIVAPSPSSADFSIRPAWRWCGVRGGGTEAASSHPKHISPLESESPHW